MTYKVKIFNTEKILTAESVEMLRVTAGIMGTEGESEVQVLALNRDYPLTTTADEIKADLARAKENFLTEETTRGTEVQVGEVISELNGLEIE